MKTEFKIGDSVIVRDIPMNRGATIGKLVGKTVKIHDVRRNGWVVLKETPQRATGWMPERFELAPAPRYAAENDHVIMLCKNGNYLPSPEPRVYSSREQAIKVAKVMTKKHGGKFVVFKAVAHAIAPEVVEPTVIEFN